MTNDFIVSQYAFATLDAYKEAGMVSEQVAQQVAEDLAEGWGDWLEATYDPDK